MLKKIFHFQTPPLVLKKTFFVLQYKKRLLNIIKEITSKYNGLYIIKLDTIRMDGHIHKNVYIVSFLSKKKKNLTNESFILNEMSFLIESVNIWFIKAKNENNRANISKFEENIGNIGGIFANIKRLYSKFSYQDEEQGITQC